jgi:hypothetical protein
MGAAKPWETARKTYLVNMTGGRRGSKAVAPAHKIVSFWHEMQVARAALRRRDVIPVGGVGGVHSTSRNLQMRRREDGLVLPAAWIDQQYREHHVLGTGFGRGR